MSKTVSVRELRSRLADLLDEVVHRREHVTITRHGRPSAVLVPVDKYEALEETAEILSDADALEAIRQGLAGLAAGDAVALEQVREEFARRAAVSACLRAAAAATRARRGSSRPSSSIRAHQDRTTR